MKDELDNAVSAGPATRKTNIQMVTELMEYSRFGGLAQAFVMDALAKHADRVATSDPDTLDTAFLSGHAWVGVAKEIKSKLDAHLSS
ncbi:MAG: hypothetical protein ACN6OP_28140 [Pseudomonadales bacterium]